MQISQDKVVTIHYTLKNKEGEVLDSSIGNDPLAYLQGHGNIIPGLENELDGKKIGDKLDVTIEPKDGYGEFNEKAIQDVPMSAFQGIDKVEVGMQFQVRGEQGPQVVTVTKVENETVTIDGNHPLAGETLFFNVEVTDVRDATSEELQHGHVHGPGGHHH